MRLVAINAPDGDECYSEEALGHLAETLDGVAVQLEVTGVDQFDRTLAYVFDGRRNVNVEMVAMGLAVASTPADDDQHGGDILEAESNAFAGRIGLWAGDACGTTSAYPDVSFDPGSSRVDPPGDDNADLAGEYVTIVNEGDEVVSLEGWLLRDESTRHRLRFPIGAVLAPGERLQIASDDPGWDPGGGAVWNNGGDMALLQLPDGTVVARWRY